MTEGWLTGWKAIAQYIGKSIKTAKKYHFVYSMPVRKVTNRVEALPYEIDQWLIQFDEIKKKIN